MAHRSPQRRRPHGVWASRRRTRVCARDRPRLDLRPWHFMRHVAGRAGWHPTDPARRGFVGVAGHGHRSRRSPDLRFAGCPWHSLHPRGVHGQAPVAGHRGPFGLPRQVLHPHRRRHTRQPSTATVLCSERRSLDPRVRRCISSGPGLARHWRRRPPPTHPIHPSPPFHLSILHR